MAQTRVEAVEMVSSRNRLAFGKHRQDLVVDRVWGDAKDDFYVSA